MGSSISTSIWETDEINETGIVEVEYPNDIIQATYGYNNSTIDVTNFIFNYIKKNIEIFNVEEETSKYQSGFNVTNEFFKTTPVDNKLNELTIITNTFKYKVISGNPINFILSNITSSFKSIDYSDTFNYDEEPKESTGTIINLQEPDEEYSELIYAKYGIGPYKVDITEHLKGLLKLNFVKIIINHVNLNSNPHHDSNPEDHYIEILTKNKLEPIIVMYNDTIEFKYIDTFKNKSNTINYLLIFIILLSLLTLIYRKWKNIN